MYIYNLMLVISGANLIFFRKISEDNWEEHDSDTWLVGLV